MRSMVILDVQWHAYRLPFVGALSEARFNSFAPEGGEESVEPFSKTRFNSFAPFATAHGVMAVREGAIVEVITEQGVSGIGEIAPLPEFGGGNLSDALTALPTLVARLRGKTLAKALDLLHTAVVERHLSPLSPMSPMSPMSPCSKNLPVKRAPRMITRALACGLEIALLDALGKVEGCGISTLLSSAGASPRPGVQVNAVVGARATEAAVTAAKEAVAAGFGCVKLKVFQDPQTFQYPQTGRERTLLLPPSRGKYRHQALKSQVKMHQGEVARVAAVREAIGPDIRLRLDANEAWSLEQAIAILSNCAQFDIQYVEQPIKASDLAGMRTLRQAVPIPIAADEALYDLESARRILDSQAADILIVKPQLAGGLRVGRQIIQEAAQRGIRSVVTSTIETGIGLVAALHLAAASPEITLECGLATRHLLVDDLLVDDLPIRNGFLAVPTGPGLGVVLDREALDKYSLSVGADSSCPSPIYRPQRE